MFRRRPLRPLRGGMRPGRRAPKKLIRAHKMMEAGNYQGAAEQFEAIARTAEAQGGSRAPQFHLQAGRARILAGHTEAGLAHLVTRAVPAGAARRLAASAQGRDPHRCRTQPARAGSRSG